MLASSPTQSRRRIRETRVDLSCRVIVGGSCRSAGPRAQQPPRRRSAAEAEASEPRCPTAAPRAARQADAAAGLRHRRVGGEGRRRAVDGPRIRRHRVRRDAARQRVRRCRSQSRPQGRRGHHDRQWAHPAEWRGVPRRRALRRGDLPGSRGIRARSTSRGSPAARPPRSPTAVVTDTLPTDRAHGWKYLAFGPDGLLYTQIGAPGNILDRGDPYATIVRMKPDGSGFEIFARGVRNSVGLAWHPDTHELWFTDNGRDMLGDEQPNDELNMAPKPGLHFGYPYCHEGSIPDPEFGKGKSCADYTAPAQKLGPHVAALGLKFYTGAMFPRGVPEAALRRQPRVVEPHASRGPHRLPADGREGAGPHGDGLRAVRRRLAAGWRVRPGDAPSICSSCPTGRCSSPTTGRT